MKKPKRTKIPYKTRVKVYAESFLRCSIPGCLSSNIEIHHIDGRRSNPHDHRSSNLLVLCKNHHDQVERGIISQKECYRIKNELLILRPSRVTPYKEREIFLHRTNQWIIRGDFDKAEAALFLFDKCLKFLNNKIDLRSVATATILFADLRMQQGIVAGVYDSFTYANQAFQLFSEEINDPVMLVRARSILGSSSRMINDFNQAAFHYKDALSFIPFIEDNVARSEMFRWVYCNLGHILRLKGDIGAARRSIEKSMDYFSSLDDKYYSAGKAESYFRLSSVLLAENSIIDSEKNLQKSQEYVIKSGIRWVKGIYNKIKFDMLTKNGRFDEAQDALQEAWDANAGSYGYQQKSLLRRVATTPKCCPDKLYLYLRDNHSNCPNCDGQTVEQMAKCTLASSKYTIFSD